MKKILSLSLALALILAMATLTACQPSNDAAYTVGIIQLAEHPHWTPPPKALRLP